MVPKVALTGDLADFNLNVQLKGDWRPLRRMR